MGEVMRLDVRQICPKEARLAKAIYLSSPRSCLEMGLSRSHSGIV